MQDDEYRTPGQLIQCLLSERGWTQRVLAIVLQISESALNKIISGKQPLDAEMSLALADIFKVPAERFLGLQKTYDLAQARIVMRPDVERANRALLFGDLPITEMIKRRWLDAEDVRSIAEVEASLVKFFGVKALHEIEILPHAAKKTNVNTPPTPVQLAWLYRVHGIAEDMLAGKYTPDSVRGVTEKLKPLLSSAEGVRKVPKVLGEAGIRFVIVESLASAKIDGVCFWLNNTSPVIGMSLRLDRIDNFWFVLRHELEHVIQGHGRGSSYMLDAELEGERAGTGATVSDEERVANGAGAEFCTPRVQMDKFVARKAPFFAERDLLGFAKTLGVHPGLVAGQLQHRTGRYDLFRTYLVKVRSTIAPSAMVDGWGDVAPVGI
jgi:HTH-type transcriptional regulator / antitoxin HigA